MIVPSCEPGHPANTLARRCPTDHVHASSATRARRAANVSMLQVRQELVESFTQQTVAANAADLHDQFVIGVLAPGTQERSDQLCAPSRHSSGVKGWARV